MNLKGKLALVDYMRDIMVLMAKECKGKELVKKLDKLTEKTLNNIEDKRIKKIIKDNYEEHIRKYIFKSGISELKLKK